MTQIRYTCTNCAYYSTPLHKGDIACAINPGHAGPEAAAVKCMDFEYTRPVGGCDYVLVRHPDENDSHDFSVFATALEPSHLRGEVMAVYPYQEGNLEVWEGWEFSEAVIHGGDYDYHNYSVYGGFVDVE